MEFHVKTISYWGNITNFHSALPLFLYIQKVRKNSVHKFTCFSWNSVNWTLIFRLLKLMQTYTPHFYAVFVTKDLVIFIVYGINQSNNKSYFKQGHIYVHSPNKTWNMSHINFGFSRKLNGVYKLRCLENIFIRLWFISAWKIQRMK